VGIVAKWVRNKPETVVTHFIIPPMTKPERPDCMSVERLRLAT
jgi:hypothetical protein